MSSFIFLERLYNKGLNRLELFFVHELSQLKLIDAMLFIELPLQLPPPKCHGDDGVWPHGN